MENIKAGGAKILLAEDNEVNRFYLRSLIEQNFENVLIFEAENGKKAVEIYKQYQPDLVLLDLNMPIMRGDQAAEMIREDANAKGEKPLIIALSGTLLDGKSPLYQTTIDNYVIKPFEADILLNILSPSLKRRKEQNAAEVAVEPEESVIQDKKHFDYEELERSLASDRQLISEVLTYVIGCLDSFSPRFRILFAEHNQEKMRGLAHELRGIALNARLPLLSEYSLAIENQERFDERFLNEQLEKVNREIDIIKPLLTAILK